MRHAALELLVCPRTGQELALEVYEAHGDDVEVGVLASDGGEYPILAGIAVFTDRAADLVALLRAGRVGEATAEAAYGQVPSSRWIPLLGGLEELRPLRPLTRRATLRLRNRQRSRDAATVADGGVDALVRRAYLETRRPSGDAYHYFVHRYGIPRHLVGLSFVERAAPGQAGLDLGCGAGHLTAALARRVAPAPVIGLDLEFFLLLVARRHLAPAADYVCASASALPVRSGAVGTVLSSDVLPYVREKWPAVRECRRALAPNGRLLLTSLRDSRHPHVFGGETLPAETWRGLLEGMPARLVPDDLVLERYLARQPAPVDVSIEDEVVARSATFSLLASTDDQAFAPRSRFEDWPHGDEVLGVNPLYVVERVDGDATTYRRHWPSETYARDNAAMAAYLPERVVVPHEAVRAVRAGGSHPAVDDLLASTAVLGLPAAARPEPWPGVPAAV